MIEQNTQTIIQNLADAGCDQPLTRQLLALMEQGKQKELLALLAKHRKTLLELCHAEQKKIDCLDYFVYQLEKNN